MNNVSLVPVTSGSSQSLAAKKTASKHKGHFFRLISGAGCMIFHASLAIRSLSEIQRMTLRFIELMDVNPSHPGFINVARFTEEMVVNMITEATSNGTRQNIEVAFQFIEDVKQTKMRRLEARGCHSEQTLQEKKKRLFDLRFQAWELHRAENIKSKLRQDLAFYQACPYFTQKFSEKKVIHNFWDSLDAKEGFLLKNSMQKYLTVLFFDFQSDFLDVERIKDLCINGQANLIDQRLNEFFLEKKAEYFESSNEKRVVIEYVTLQAKILFIYLSREIKRRVIELYEEISKDIVPARLEFDDAYERYMYINFKCSRIFLGQPSEALSLDDEYLSLDLDKLANPVDFFAQRLKDEHQELMSLLQFSSFQPQKNSFKG